MTAPPQIFTTEASSSSLPPMNQALRKSLKPSAPFRILAAPIVSARTPPPSGMEEGISPASSSSHTQPSLPPTMNGPTTSHNNHTPCLVGPNSERRPMSRLQRLKFEVVQAKRQDSSLSSLRLPNNNTSDNGSIASASTRNRRKFRTIAHGLSMMSRARLRTTESAIEREQNAFMSKFGLRMAGGEGGQLEIDPALEEMWQRSKWEYFKEKFVADPSSDYFYYWLALVSLAFVWNLISIIFRCVFIDGSVGSYWLGALIAVDVLADLIYLVDIFVRSRTGYLERGLLVRDVSKISHLYWNGSQRGWDIIGVVPLDYLHELWHHTPNPIMRFNRLARIDRTISFITATEMSISSPNAFRVVCVLFYILVLIHWNACLYFLASYLIGVGSDSWVYGPLNTQSMPVWVGWDHPLHHSLTSRGLNDTIHRRYIYSVYWSTMILTTIGEVPGPVLTSEFVFVTMDLMCGILIFATIVGNVGSMIANSSRARSEFQVSIDNIKRYMRMRKVSPQLVERITNWFDYLWANKKQQGAGGDAEVLSVLPTKLQAEIAMHVHFEVLRKVRIFQDCESGLLAELVLKLKLNVFSPGDFVCRKGDVGKELYIVKQGKLQVVSDDGGKVFATLGEGAVFGELSILNIAGSKNGNRRTANIRSVGYTDLFVLSKADLWEALREYPGAQKMLIQRGRDLLFKDGLLDENAPEVTKTSEETALELQGAVEVLQSRLAKLIAEHVSMQNKLKARVEFLEAEVNRYEEGEGIDLQTSTASLLTV